MVIRKPINQVNKLEIYTISFFGHRYIENMPFIEIKLENIIREAIQKYEYVNFLVGREGDFDQIASSAIRHIKKNYLDFNSSLIWVMPYQKAEYQKNKTNFEKYYDEIEICYESSMVHPKAAIQLRNKIMVNRSQLVVFGVNKTSGGAYRTMKYAIKCGKKIINVCE